jgi:hypothetical protein
MANTDAPFGFSPYGEVLRAQWYPLVTAVATACYVGDLMAAVSTGLVCKAFGGDTRMSVISQPAGAAGRVMGVCVGLLNSSGDPVNRIAASEAGDGVVAGYALIADHPDQLFLAQEDGDTTPIAAASVGLNVDGISSHTPSAKNNYLSKMELDSNTVQTTNTLAMRLVQSYKDDSVGSAYCRWVVIVNPNAHFYNSATAI